MPKKKHKADQKSTKVVVETTVQPQPKPRVEEEFAFNKYTTKKIKVQFVAEAEVEITDIQ